MDFKISDLTEKYLKQVVIVILLLIIPVIFLARGFYVLHIETKNLNTEQSQLKDEKLQFEKYRAEEKTKLAHQRNNQPNQSRIAEKKATELDKREVELSNLISDYNSRFKKLKLKEQKLQPAFRKIEAEKKADASIEEFTRLGVNLDRPDWCNHEYTKRYQRAEIIMSKINGLVNEYKLGADYSYFASVNSKGLIITAPETCETALPLNK